MTDGSKKRLFEMLYPLLVSDVLTDPKNGRSLAFPSSFASTNSGLNTSEGIPRGSIGSTIAWRVYTGTKSAVLGTQRPRS